MSEQRNDKNNLKNSFFTKETFGMILALFSTLVLICLITGDVIFGGVISDFLLGSFGFFSYVLLVSLIYLSIVLITDKYFIKRSKTVGAIFAVIFVIILLLQVITTRDLPLSSYGDYLSACYKAGEKGADGTFGGVVFGLFSYFLLKGLTLVGSIVILSLIICLAVYYIIKTKYTGAPEKKQKTKNSPNVLGYKYYPVNDVDFPAMSESGESEQKLYLRDETFELKKKKDVRQGDFKIVHPNKSSSFGVVASSSQTQAKKEPSYERSAQSKLNMGKSSYTSAYGSDMADKLKYITTPYTINIPKSEEEKPKDQSVSKPITKQEDVKSVSPADYTFKQDGVGETGKRAEEYSKYADLDDYSYQQAEKKEVSEERIIPIIDATEEDVYEEPIKQQSKREETIEETNVSTAIDGRRQRGGLFSEQQSETEEISLFGEEPIEEKPVDLSSRRSVRDTARSVMPEISSVKKESFEKKPEKKQEEQTKPEKPAIPINRPYYRPPMDLFKTYKPDVNAPKENHEQRGQIIERTLSEFGIDAKVFGFVQGPTVTRYEILMPAGVSVKKVPTHADDIAMRLESENGVRIEAPIPGKNLVGIEVPNKVKQIVGLRDILESDAFNKTKPGQLTFALGKNIVGDCICDNLAKGPHYLVAGATGMGKSVCLNSMIVSLITKYSPEDLRLILIDPKQVEFTIYNHLPHLMIDEIINDAPKAIATLSWAVAEMENRYTLFKDNEVRDIDEYNEIIASDTVARIPKIVIIVDEVSDLMQYNRRELEARILSLSQKARAAGIHLVLATQRPSVDVITGVIKTNLPSRIAFRVGSAIDSGTILSEGGAEKLLGNGDMLYKNSTMPKFERYQGAFISMPEVKSIVQYIKSKNEAYFNDEAAESINNSLKPQVEDAPISAGESEGGGGEDSLFIDALRHVINSGSASISMLQRRFQIGYAKAGSLIDKMDRMGYISPFDGSRARQVLITLDEFNEKYGDAE